MDLLETVLRTANAVQYLDQFKKEQIDAHTLKLLTDEDLQIIGIDDEAVRQAILRQSKNLQIPSERKIDVNVNHEYIKEVLGVVAHQLLMYNATLTPLIIRPDIKNYDIPLAKASDALSTAIYELHDEVLNLRIQLMKQTGAVKANARKTRIMKGVLFSIFMVTNLYAVRSLIKFILK